MGLWILSLFGWRLASVLRSCYFWFRYVDDIVDHDLKCQESIEEFSQSRKELLENIHDEAKLSKLKLKQIDWLIIDVYYACLKLGYDNQTSMLTLYEALEYDIIRTVENKTYYTKAEIKEYFDKLDIPSVLMTFQFINEKAVTVDDLAALIDATRTRYNLRDFIQDLLVGIVNIPLEEIEQYGIDIKQCLLANDLTEALRYEPFKLWFKDQLAYIEERLATGSLVVKEKPLRFRTRLALTYSFINPCEASLKKWRLLV